ncbi:MAG: NADH-quinone oxidoreductase subunit NuoB [Methanomassiliicoccales archaeon]
MLDIIRKGVLRKGIVTSDYPQEGTPRYAARLGFPKLRTDLCKAHHVCFRSCPTNAIQEREGEIKVDLGLCIFCAQCARSCPEGAWTMSPEIELAKRSRSDLLSSSSIENKSIQELGKSLDAMIGKVFGRSLAIREVDTGSCNACEVEVNALSNAVHDIERFGMHIVASPRHADLLLVTGPVTRNMERALMQTYKATPEPKLVVAVGACACSGGIFRESYAVRGGVDRMLPVDVYIPGCPPRPEAMIYGLMLAVGKLNDKSR